jgi:type II secretory pathway component PulJ
MHLVEVMVAAAVFSAASGSSLQLWSHAAGSSHRAELRQQLLERIDLDRLQLQAHWRQELAGGSGCGLSSGDLVEVASALPVPPQLRREVVPVQSGDGLLVRWEVAADPTTTRERVYTPAGLGLCHSESPLTDSQVEEVQP